MIPSRCLILFQSVVVLSLVILLSGCGGGGGGSESSSPQTHDVTFRVVKADDCDISGIGINYYVAGLVEKSTTIGCGDLPWTISAPITDVPANTTVSMGISYDNAYGGEYGSLSGEILVDGVVWKTCSITVNSTTTYTDNSVGGTLD